jgi:uncharacterized protein
MLDTPWGIVSVRGLGNVVFLAAALILRFVRTGGIAMLRMMGGSPQGNTHVSHTH